MTPQERELITTLFERLTALENAPRDPEAERVIAEGLARAPHAIYPLVQTVLVQDEALKAANGKIEELLTELGEPPAPEPEQRPRGFLDTMRESLLGRGETPPHAGSVPSVRPGGSPWAGAPGYRDQQGYREEGPPMGGPGYGGYGGGPGGPGGGQGGSFLGTAAASAAGMIGGSLLLGGIRSMLGGHGAHGSPFAGTFDHLSGGGAGSGDLARRAGLDDIGRAPGGGGEASRAGLLGSSDDEGDEHEGDDDGDDDDGSSDDTDYA
ncbi:MAG TPA: DUF2076 domain-containing protein [Xanthobacteraceae bacterium]|jgi:hypothetical protein|nr:DUF2076 domain-containing protein [Xanthobacteraceae bacterium]